MGYTHYWKKLAPIAPEDWAPFVAKAKRVVEKSGVLVAWDYDFPDKAPEFGPELIRFNGKGDDGHETFFLGLDPTDFDFCKTARKPYDLAVTAVLLLAADMLGAEISSDGRREDWEEAAKLTGLPIPSTIRG